MARPVPSAEAYVRLELGLSADVELPSKITIPRSSFTAFRLTYARYDEISDSSKVVLIGSVPKLWTAQRKNGLLKTVSKVFHGGVGKHVTAVSRNVRAITYGEDSVARRVFRDSAKYETRFLSMFDSDTESEEEEDVVESPVVPRLKADRSVKSPRTKPVTIREPVIDYFDKQKTDESVNSELPFQTTDESVISDVPIQTTDESVISDEQSIKDSTLDSTSEVFYSAEELPSDEEVPPILPHTASTMVPEHDSLVDDATIRGIFARSTAASNVCWSNTMEDQSIEGYESDDPLSAKVQDPPVISLQPPAPIQSILNSPLYSDTTSKPQLSPSLVQFSQTPPIRTVTEHSDDLSLVTDVSDVDSKFPTDSPLRLRALVPEPEMLTEQQQQLVENSTKRNRHIIGKVIKGARNAVVNEVSAVLDRDYRRSRRLMKGYKKGEIIRLEKMLVMVKQCITQVQVPAHFSEIEQYDTKVVERWKEFFVVARATGNDTHPISIQFYKERDIPKSEDALKVKKSKMDFFVNTECVIGLYSTLDKTIHIVRPMENAPFKIYILRCKSLVSSHRWLTMLRETIGLSLMTQNINVSMPNADAELSLHIPFDIQKSLIMLGNNEATDAVIYYTEHGYMLLPLPVARLISLYVKHRLQRAGYGKQVEDWRRCNQVLGLAWRHYDRIEWVFGETQDMMSLIFTVNPYHNLEYRPFKHYPRVTITDTGLIAEPTPVEGFLAKITDRAGKDSSSFFHKPFYHLVYVYSNNNLLFFTSSFKGVPPLPKNESTNVVSGCAGFSDMKEVERIIETLPIVYEHNPFPLKGNHIEWLRPGITPEDFEELDKYAFQSFERRVSLIIRSEGVVNMEDVLSVSKRTVGANHDSVKYNILRNANNFAWKTHFDIKETAASIIELRMRNGVPLAFMAPSSKVADEWVSRLSQLVEYWTAKHAETLYRISQVKDCNMQKMHIDEQAEAIVGERTPKWVTDAAIADPCIHNISTHAMMRPLVHCGFLYIKTHKHSHFRKRYAVLIPGFLIFYNCFKRSKSGVSTGASYYRHSLTVPITECYVYSGSLTSTDLLERDRVFDPQHPGRHSLPRLYPDGWKSIEDEPTRCFTLWFGAKRAIAGASADGNPGVIRMTSRLGVTGHGMVLMTRSRQEKDMWVTRIFAELERLQVDGEKEYNLV